jgi:hypothetical protein
MDDIRWGRSVLNGLFVWLLSLAVYLVPGFTYGFWLVTQQDPGDQDYGALSRQMSQDIPRLYQENWLLLVGLIVITAVIIFWRARAVARGTWNMRWLNGLLVGVVPAVLSLLFVLCGGFEVIDGVMIGLYVVAGLLGGISARPT